MLCKRGVLGLGRESKHDREKSFSEHTSTVVTVVYLLPLSDLLPHPEPSAPQAYSTMRAFV